MCIRDSLGVIENNTALPPSRITIKWKEDAQFEENLERIITQKWIAIFPLGNEAWAEYRRTGYPKPVSYTHLQGQAEYYYDYPGIYFRIRETWLS